jgi:uncharacterized membrane protein YqjE
MTEISTGPDGRADARQRPAGELVKDLTTQVSTLVRQELELAKVELTEKGKQAGIGAGMFGGAGVLALYGVGALVATAILALATAVDGWLAALIVAVVYGAIAGVLALTGKKQVEQGTPPVPERAIESTKEDIQSTRDHAKAARND